MPVVINGPGNPLPPPQALYPAILYNAPYVAPTNRITLTPGDAIQIPASPQSGYVVSVGAYGVRQYLDPVTLAWQGFSSVLTQNSQTPSDGFNYRVANLTACPITAIVTNKGSGTYVQSTTSITAAAGGSTWQAIIGGVVNSTVASVTSVVAGGGYTIAPICFIPSPPPPGVSATAAASISSNSVSTVTLTNQGAGYPSAPPLLMLPSVYDPNYVAGSITFSSVSTLSLTGAGLLGAVICTGNGTQQGGSMPSLTVTGAGSSAAATVVPYWTIASNSIAAAGAGYAAGNNALLATGGIPTAAAAWTNPTHELTAPIPRQAQGYATLTGTTITTIVMVDSGIYYGTPYVLAVGGTTLASIVPTMGGANTVVTMQPT